MKATGTVGESLAPKEPSRDKARFPRTPPRFHERESPKYSAGLIFCIPWIFGPPSYRASNRVGVDDSPIIGSGIELREQNVSRPAAILFKAVFLLIGLVRRVLGTSGAPAHPEADPWWHVGNSPVGYREE
jgi:hypothetical protein